MNNDIRNEGTDPVNEANSDVRPGSDDADMVQLLVRLGVSDDGLYLSNERIVEIAESDADEEKRQLAARVLQLQLYVKSITAIRTLNFRHTPGGNNVFNPLDPLDESRFIRLSELKGHSGSPETGE